jgi:GTP pyrophosphokinase
VGDRCAGGKINGKLMPLSTPLKSGDTVEIITDPHRHPSRDWLKFVKTAKARTRIQHFIRTEERARSISLGKEILEKQGRRAGINFQKMLKDGDLSKTAAELNFSSVDNLISAVGYARITPRKVLALLLPKSGGETVPSGESASRPGLSPKTTSVSIKGVDDILVRFAKCCNPVPGDPIVGYISRGRGVAVHTADCPTVSQMEPERLLPVYWDGGGQSEPFPARIRLICQNVRGVMAKIAALLEANGVNIDSGQFRSTVDGRTEIEMVIEIGDVAQLLQIIEKLRKVEHVLEVSRITSSGVTEH